MAFDLIHELLRPDGFHLGGIEYNFRDPQFNTQLHKVQLIMTERLSDRFYGNKIFKHEHFEALGDVKPHQSVLRDAFQRLMNKYEAINKELGQLLIDFLTVNAEFAQSQQFEFQKFATFLELTAYLFEWSFDNHKTRQQSFEEFKDLVIRHSLFRPPHSVNIFNEDDVKNITKFWLETFDRYYDLYQHCFATELHYCIETWGSPIANEHTIKSGKVVADKSSLAGLFG